MQNILIGGAWPYANGSLHIGHIAALLPGDVLARYYRLRGDRVFYVSGSDCHGTPITIRAQQEGKSPAEISERYHAEFCAAFEKLGFSYDLYTKTSDPHHIAFVQSFHRKMYESPYIEERSVQQVYCPRCRKALADRLIVGKCPSCGSETRDTDFSWREFAERNNSELVGAWGNFVNRTLAFITKYLDGRIPQGSPDPAIQAQLQAAFPAVGRKIEAGNFKSALEEVFGLIRFGNKYYDSGEPWKTRTADPAACADTLSNCVQLIANLSALLAPFLPFSSEKVRGWLQLEACWSPQTVPAGLVLPEISILFERIDLKAIEQERAKL